jgi:hypothetical protein
MMKYHFYRCAFLLLVLEFLFVSGCASTGPSRYYTLSPLQKAGIEMRRSEADQRLTIGIGPIRFPEYLERSEIVTRSNSNKIEISEFDLWAGSLEEDFGRVLSENLSILLSTERVTLFPQPKTLPLNYQVMMDVIRFDGSLGGDVSLMVRWMIMEGKEKKLVFIHKSSIIESSGAKGYEPMVAAQSRALERLSREIAEAIQNLSK